MRLFSLLIAAVLAAPTALHAQVFLGFTEATFQGDVGVFTFQGACAAEFDGRMCTSAEILGSSTTPVGLVGTAWVRPSFQPVTRGGGSIMSLDASGVFAFNNASLTCEGWSGAAETATGLFVDAAGRFWTRGASVCAEFRSVACCAPASCTKKNGGGRDR